MKKTYKNIVILTGAGVSAESGLDTFRSHDGLWCNHKVEDVATIEAFIRQPEYVHQFYNQLKPQIAAATPNEGHLALAKLEKEYGGQVHIVTQNVDTLHEKAGSKNVYHIHGQINQAVCLRCRHIIQSWEDVGMQTICPQCGATGKMKPNIVFFGEELLAMGEVDRLLKSCDLFVSVGTSGVVYPAAGFVQIAKMYGAQAYEFNLDKTLNNYLFDKHIYGKSSAVLPEFVKEMLDFQGANGE